MLDDFLFFFLRIVNQNTVPLVYWLYLPDFGSFVSFEHP